MWSSNKIHCQYIRCSKWVGHSFLDWTLNRFHSKYISFFGNVLFLIASGHMGLLNGWATRSFTDSRMFQRRVIRLLGLILCAWICIHQRYAYGLGNFIVSFFYWLKMIPVNPMRISFLVKDSGYELGAFYFQ